MAPGLVIFECETETTRGVNNAEEREESTKPRAARQLERLGRRERGRVDVPQHRGARGQAPVLQCVWKGDLILLPRRVSVKCFLEEKPGRPRRPCPGCGGPGGGAGKEAAQTGRAGPGATHAAPVADDEELARRLDDALRQHNRAALGRGGASERQRRRRERRRPRSGPRAAAAARDGLCGPGPGEAQAPPSVHRRPPMALFDDRGKRARRAGAAARRQRVQPVVIQRRGAHFVTARGGKETVFAWPGDAGGGLYARRAAGVWSLADPHG